MNFVRVTAIAIFVAIGSALMVANAEAQLPPAPTPQATRAALLNPNWCSDVPASPPPPNFELRSGNWASFRQMCMNLSFDMGCVYTCGYAEDLWRLQKSGKLNQPNTFPSPTDQPQGPFPQPGGSKGYILPAQPAPVPSGPTSDAADSTSALSAVLAPGPFSSYFGQDLSATTKGQGQPPDVSADVSPKENAEFINYLGLWVWNKPTLPVPQPAPTPTLQMSNNDFWCKLPGVSGQRLPGCDVNGNELLGLLADTQIGYDATLGRWTATQLAANGTYAPATITSALENGSTANITTKTNPYGLVVGDIVTIAGVSVAGYNGNFPVTAIPSGTTFQYTRLLNLGAGSGGTAQLVPQVGYLYFAASKTNKLNGTGSGWNLWSARACTTSPSFPQMDQPLLGWSGPNTSGNSVVDVDVTCFSSPNNFGPDNIFVIPSSSIASVSQTLPAPISGPCAKMAPARDEGGSSSRLREFAES